MKNELALKQRIAELEKLLAQKDAQIAALEERWNLAQHRKVATTLRGSLARCWTPAKPRSHLYRRQRQRNRPFQQRRLQAQSNDVMKRVNVRNFPF